MNFALVEHDKRSFRPSVASSNVARLLSELFDKALAATQGALATASAPAQVKTFVHKRGPARTTEMTVSDNDS